MFLVLGRNSARFLWNACRKAKFWWTFCPSGPNTLSTTQINNMLKTEHGRAFLKANPGITSKLKNYSAFYCSRFPIFNLNIGSISGTLASLPHEGKLKLFLNTKNGNFCQVAFNLSRFWKSEAVVNDADIWEAIDLVTLTVESKQSEAFKMYSVAANIGSKIKGPIEDSFLWC